MDSYQQEKSFKRAVEDIFEKLTDPEPYDKLMTDLGQLPERDQIEKVKQSFENVFKRVTDTEQYEKVADDVGNYLFQDDKKPLKEVLQIVTAKIFDTEPYSRFAEDFDQMELSDEEQDTPFVPPQEQKIEEKEEVEIIQPVMKQPEILEQTEFIIKPQSNVEHPKGQNQNKEQSEQNEQNEQNIAGENLSQTSPRNKIQPKVERQVSNPVFKVSEEPVVLEERNTMQEGLRQSKKQKQFVEVRQRQKTGSSRNIRIHSSQESVNLELTLKTKNTKNLSNSYGRQDSLVYSNATLLNSQDTAFNQPKPRSYRSVLHNIQNNSEGEQKEQLEKIQRAESRQIDRTSRERESSFELEEPQKKKSEEAEGGIFKTEIKEYKNKIAKIRSLKEEKKRKLQAQLKKINSQIENLAGRKELQSQSSKNNFQSRVKISDNIEARMKAERLVKDLRMQKKSRHEALLGDVKSVDKNIHLYMEELMKERYKNEERLKQRKKFEIIERMKQHQMRKIEDEKQKNKNMNFLMQLKQSNNTRNAQPKAPASPVQISPTTHDKYAELDSRKRSPTKASEKGQPKQFTPELSRKKEYLRKVRNIKFIKDKPDKYEQSLM